MIKMSDYKYYTPVALLDALLEHLPEGEVRSVIDISCGSFNLLKSALKKYPTAKCVGVDIEDQVVETGQDIRFFKQDGRVFAKQQNQKKISYDLILTNPPFGRLKKEDRLFQEEKHAVLCSRYECEMMYANSLLAREGSRIIAILPATFAEGDLYIKYRQKLAEDYDVKSLIKLPATVFSKGEISAYAIILCKTTTEKKEPTYIGNATLKDAKWQISYSDTVEAEKVKSGIWVVPNSFMPTEEKKQIDSIYRGNISSKFFSPRGTEILHCSSIFQNGRWKPSQYYCKDYPSNNLKYVRDGDILINRIGKNAGFWTKYRGEEQLISDCLIVVHGGNKIEEYLLRHSVDGRLLVPIKGVATKYISIADLNELYFL